jgi:DNA repair exonuclease SbcCD ATPase subunit
MITLKTLEWSNLFSYGLDNVVQFDKDPITQLIGKNGHGKSSIALVLEEALFNKNSKGIKKSDILNRHIKDKSYSIKLSFNKDGDEYVIKTTRGSTQTVKLSKNGEDISSHTATATFKLIEDVIGIDHKAFSQLVYQSSSASLEFLTATDTNRKKFLIDLLNLTKYLEAFEVFKAVASELSKEVIAIESSMKTTQSWLDKHSGASLELEPIIPEPSVDPKLEQELADLKVQQTTILEENKRITKNNQYRSQLESIDLESIKSAPSSVEDTSSLSVESGEHKKVIKDADTFITKVAKLDGTCPTCLQKVDRKKLDELIAEQEELKAAASAAVKKIDAKLLEVSATKKKYDAAQKLKSEWESYHALVDQDMTTELLDAEVLSDSIYELSNAITEAKANLESVRKCNERARASNAKAEVISEQIDQMQKDLGEYSSKLTTASDKLALLQILQKTFSTSGLIAYKIECLIKDLEDLANEYLAELSDGRFQLTFKVAASDKLNVVITDNGRDIDILALSGGERARVNTATLLAIRKLMQSLSNARINLLVLDETIDALDVDGKEKLVEVLLKEEHLNTILISHGFTHPLLEKITVLKENNISRLE